MDGRHGNGNATVSAKGQVVIPARFRRELGIRKGTRVSVTQENGQLILQPVTREFIRSLHGCLKGEPNLLEMCSKRAGGNANVKIASGNANVKSYVLDASALIAF